MNKLKIYKPSIKDLWFKEKMLSDKETMSYNHFYGGTITFPKSKWSDWYNQWMNNSERFYRYLKDQNDNFVGEIAYYQEDFKTVCSILIFAKERNKGYGTIALKMLCDIAKENNILELYDYIAIDNPSINLFLNAGFMEVERNKEVIIVKKIL